MTKPALQGICGVAALYLASVLLPAVRLLQPASAVRHSGPPAGVDWLSLPPDFAAADEPLDGWDRLSRRRTVPAFRNPVLKEQAETPEVPLEADPFHIEVYGLVERSGREMYCILDTRAGRWFRLGPDQADAESGIRLGRAGGSLQITDLGNGRRFAVYPGKSHPVPIPDQPPITTEDETRLPGNL